MSSTEKKKIREAFRAAVFKRDRNRCKVCGASSSEVPLDAHHITPRKEMPNGGYVKENGITLCDRSGGCHEKAEDYFAAGGTQHPGFTPNELYSRISSSLVEAHEASMRLKS